MKASRARGFTLVELLVVITIIGILIGLLLPAVQAVRAAARRTQCRNNLKQLALAVLNYENSFKILPPSAHWAPGVLPETKNPSDLRENWVILILPFVEQQALYDAIDRSKPINHPDNMLARSTELSVMTCPSDPYSRRPFNGSKGANTTNAGDNWARGNYAANACLALMSSGGGALPTSPGWQSPTYRGVMGANSSVGITEIKDGTTNTIMLAEIRAGLTDYDARGIWAMSGGCPSALWGHGGILGDDYGPNCPYFAADDMQNCSQLRAEFGDSSFMQTNGNFLAKKGMPCSGVDAPNSQQTARSLHEGGVHVAMADGSVQWIGDFIQTKPSTAANLSVWDRLNASSDNQTVEAGAF